MSSHSHFGRTDTGIYTVEGNVAGRKAARLTKKREQDQKDYEAKKRKIQEESQKASGSFDSKFSSITHNAFNLDFVGLKTKEEFQSMKDAAEEEYNRQQKKDDEEAKRKEKEEKRKKKLKESKTSRLSFAMGGDDEEEKEDGGEIRGKKEEKKESNGNGTSSLFRKKPLKNPEAVTDFLPDPERDRQEKELREKLKQEWLEEQEKINNEILEVTYSYWDGSGHRRVLTLKKGTTIAKFLELVKAQVGTDFSEVRAVSPDDLMYIKEDLIIPHNYSFYDLIVTKARGKSGPLFHFDVHEDVRMINDARIEKDESHPGKVVDRKWYERNKHIFPASRWEVYDPKVDRGNYTIHGGEVVIKKK